MTPKLEVVKRTQKASKPSRACTRAVSSKLSKLPG
jgi:hypothetical protein